MQLPEGYTQVNGQIPNVLYELKKINVFVGGNNSGKSRFMRSIINCPRWLYTKEKLNAFSKEKFVDLVKCIISTDYRNEQFNGVNALDIVMNSYRSSLYVGLLPQTHLFTDKNTCYIPVLRGIENFERF
jgi:predicted ATPase